MMAIDINDPNQQRLRRYLGWARNLSPQDKRRLVIDPLAKRMAVLLDIDQADQIDKPQCDQYRRDDKVKAWPLGDTGIFLLMDGVAYDPTDSAGLGLPRDIQDAVIDTLMGMFPRRFLLDDFIDMQIKRGRWVDKFDQAEAAS